MNLPATKRLMRREMTKIINKLLVVIPKIPEEGYRKSQEAILSDIEKKYTTVASNEDELKRLFFFFPPNIFKIIPYKLIFYIM